MAGVKSRSGGIRPGAGRPREIRDHSDETIARWEDAAQKLSKEKGCTIEYHLLSMLFDTDVQDSVKASIMKAYNDALIVKKTETKTGAQNFDNLGPTIYKINEHGEEVVVRQGCGSIWIPERNKGFK